MWRGAAVQALSGALRGKQGKLQLPSLPLALQQRRQFADASSLKKTVLYDYHVEQGGKMVPFAGYSMPIQYKDSIIDSTTNCRTNGSLFDVSHMCGLSLKVAVNNVGLWCFCPELPASAFLRFPS